MLQKLCENCGEVNDRAAVKCWNCDVSDMFKDIDTLTQAVDTPQAAITTAYCWNCPKPLPSPEVSHCPSCHAPQKGR